MVLQTVTSAVGRSVDGATGAVTGLFGDTTVRLGVTGLSRAGKTVFITSLVANMLNRGRMPQFTPIATGSLKTAFLQPQPDDTVARFAYETHLDAILGTNPTWPASTRTMSELRLSFRVQPSGLIGNFTGPRTVHLDIVDYPGEWLLDLGLLDMDYDTWSAQALKNAGLRPQSAAFLAQLAQTDGAEAFSDPVAEKLASSFAQYLIAAREAGFSNCTPGRFLLPGDLAGSPALTFAPLPPGPGARRSLRTEMQRRYEAYKSRVVRPFFRDHFSRIDRQIVLVDVLRALSHGPKALADLEQAMTGILTAFRPGRNGFLSEIFLGRRVERILFAATKADHIHHSQHDALSGLTQALTQNARDRAAFQGAETQAISIAALRTTTELDLPSGEAAVQGIAAGTGKPTGYYPGELPTSPAGLLAEARGGADTWQGGGFGTVRFDPPKMEVAAGNGPPHIRMDKAMQFLIGDALG